MNLQTTPRSFQIPSASGIAWFLTTLGVRQTMAQGDAPAAPSLQAEYQELLAQRTIDELRAIAEARHIEVTADSKSALVKNLAAHLCDLQDTCAQIENTPLTGQRILAYLHVVLTPGRGLSAENALSELSLKIESPYLDPSKRQAQDTPANLVPDDDVDDSSHFLLATDQRRNHKEIYAHTRSLSQRGLLLPFRQHNATYYSVPLAVRACLPPLLHIDAPSMGEDERGIQVQTLPHTALLDKLYAVWRAITTRSARGKEVVSSAPPPRHPAEDQWAALQDWDNPPSEITTLIGTRGATGAHGHIPGMLTQSLTVPAPHHTLKPADRLLLGAQTGCTDQELDFYLHLLWGISALHISPGRAIVVSVKDMYGFLSLPPREQLQRLYQAWSASTSWSEMNLVLDNAAAPSTDDGGEGTPLRLRRSLMYAEFKPADLYQEWRAGRLAVLRLLTALPGEQWISNSSFLAAMWEINANLLHTRSAPSVWWLESRRTRRQFGATFDDWRQSYGQFVAATIQYSLAWLGLVTLASKDGHPYAFKLTPTGRMVLGQQGVPDQLNAHDAPAAELGEDMTVKLAPSQASPELHELLGFVGEIIQATPSQFVYRLTADGIRRWCEAAYAPQKSSTAAPPAARCQTAVRRFIERLSQLLDRVHAGTEILPAWHDMLVTWMRNYGSLHVYEGITVLDLADDYALQELLASTSLREHILYQFSPRLIAIHSNAIEDLVEEMEKRGYTPRVE